MNDNELFELCKEVYKRTNWGGTLDYFEDYPVLGDVITKRSFSGIPDNLPDLITPLYTSDYLLEKLPVHCDKNRAYNLVLDVETYYPYKRRDNRYRAFYKGEPSNKLNEYSDTPLKALLKLVISLDDAGVKL